MSAAENGRVLDATRKINAKKAAAFAEKGATAEW